MYATIEAPRLEDLQTLEELSEYGRILRESNDSNLWELGDCAGMVETRYGVDAIGTWAMEVNISKSRAKALRQTAGFYERDYRQSYSNLSFSHFETAMRVEPIMSADEFLEMSSNNGWTVDQARRELKIIKGGTALTKLTEFVAEAVQIKADGTICITPVDGFDPSQLITSKQMTFRVYIESEASA